MAVVATVTAEGTPLSEYDAIMKEAGLTGASADKIPHLRAHYAWEEDGSVHVLDVWDSAEAFQAFFGSTIGPAAARAGITMNPEVKISPLHASIT